jgi:hypothetical protein
MRLQDICLLDERLQGYDIREGQLVLGLRSYEDIKLENALHELCHLVDCEDDNIFKIPYWGLKVKRFRTTDQHIQREIKIFAYQQNLSPVFKIPFNLNKMAEIAMFLPDADLFKYTKNKFKTLICEKASESEFSSDKALAEVTRKLKIIKDNHLQP